jgi:hypothetical protein
MSTVSKKLALGFIPPFVDKILDYHIIVGNHSTKTKGLAIDYLVDAH